MLEPLHAPLMAAGTIIAAIAHLLNVIIPDPVKGLLLIPVIYLMWRGGLKLMQTHPYSGGQLIGLTPVVLFLALILLLPGKLYVFVDPLVNLYISAVITYVIVQVYLSVKAPLHKFVRRMRKR